MPSDVLDIDRVYAEKACRASCRKRVLHALRFMRAGEALTIYAPSVEEVEAVAKVFAAYRLDREAVARQKNGERS